MFLSVTLNISTGICFCFTPGDCEAAICGGVNSIIDPLTFVSLSKAKMISPDGMSKPFSKKADGYGRGEGCGVVFLKPLKKVRLFVKKPKISLASYLNFVYPFLVVTVAKSISNISLLLALGKHLCFSSSVGKITNVSLLIVLFLANR